LNHKRRLFEPPFDLFILDGSQQTRLTYDPRADWQPRWGP
jgi:hypothetical protein